MYHCAAEWSTRFQTTDFQTLDGAAATMATAGVRRDSRSTRCSTRWRQLLNGMLHVCARLLTPLRLKDLFDTFFDNYHEKLWHMKDNNL
jgi:hypothetical protein